MGDIVDAVQPEHERSNVPMSELALSKTFSKRQSRRLKRRARNWAAGRLAPPPLGPVLACRRP
jgi:hypothetical protein